jgi:hypothetical protein
MTGLYYLLKNQSITLKSKLLIDRTTLNYKILVFVVLHKQITHYETTPTILQGRVNAAT